jgi:hypothetical protein
MSGWRAGAAATTFEVPIGTPMAGFMARIGGVSGVADPLTVSALTLQVDGKRLLILAADLLGVDRETVNELENRLGFPPGWIALCASHTHSGPAGITRQVRNDPTEPLNAALRAAFIDACVRAGQQAVADVVEASLAFGVAPTSGISANRNDPNGPFDPTAHVLQARAVTGDAIATLVQFACHPTILPASSNLLSAEFPGAMRRALKADNAGTVLFANGAAGDVSTRYTRQSQDQREVERVGQGVAEAVRNAIVHAQQVEPALSLRETPVELAPRDPEEIRAIVREARATIAQADLTSRDAAERRIMETRAQGIEILEQIAERIGAEPTRVSIPRWRLGDLTFIGIPGELFASLGELCTQGDDHRVILGYTNGYLGYFANRAAYDDGLYEALASPFAPGASEAMVTGLLGDQ